MSISQRPTAKSPVLDAFFSAPHDRLLVIAGPCMLDDSSVNSRIGHTLRQACAELKLPFVFKASFDKANRSSIHSLRGPGLDAGLKELERLRNELGMPVTTDIHEPAHAAPVADAVDLLQIPAFLCRQTDLLAAAGATGRPVNVKKGQFMAPEEMKNVLEKLKEAGCKNTMLTERGTFFGYHRLVTDFIGLGDMMALGAPVCFDATHSTQLPGATGKATGGRPDRCALLARAAVAAGVDAVFVECHPEPARSQSDAATIQPLDRMPALLAQLARVRAAARASIAAEHA
jgi:2-dehydro-3-deoxyphosphooctonate aldolase (KDO 8-P synthase)